MLTIATTYCLYGGWYGIMEERKKEEQLHPHAHRSLEVKLWSVFASSVMIILHKYPCVNAETQMFTDEHKHAQGAVCIVLRRGVPLFFSS